MSKSIPPVRKYMSTSPHSINLDQNLMQAHALMREHTIRHLPVLEGGVLVGVLSARDLSQIEALVGGNPKQISVGDAMSTNVYATTPDAPLDEVVDEMASRKLGCAVVMDHSHVVGIVTTVDVCRALAELLRGRLHA